MTNQVVAAILGLRNPHLNQAGCPEAWEERHVVKYDHVVESR